MPAMENPEERAALNYSRRRKRAYQTGTANYSRSQAIQRMMKTGMEKSMATSGGTKGLNQMSKMFQNAMLGLQDQDMKGEMNYAAMERQSVEKLADRRLQLQLLKYNTMQARSADMIKGGRSNMYAGMASMMGGGEVADGGATSSAFGGAGESAALDRDWETY